MKEFTQEDLEKIIASARRPAEMRVAAYMGNYDTKGPNERRLRRMGVEAVPDSKQAGGGVDRYLTDEPLPIRPRNRVRPLRRLP